MFFGFCLVGWLWEVTLHLITHGEFVNRGMLHGPWLPIYGGGVVMIAVLLGLAVAAGLIYLFMKNQQSEINMDDYYMYFSQLRKLLIKG